MLSARAVAELAIQRETSPVQMEASIPRVNVSTLARSNTNSARVRTIVAGDTESGRTARVLDIKRDASRVGTATRTQQPTTAQKKRSQHQNNNAVHRQTVSFVRGKTFLQLK